MKIMICNCGREFKTYDVRKGRGKYCSKSCMYKYRSKTPWNKGLVGLQIAWNKGKSCDWKEDKHPLWKKEDYGYSAVHNWIRKYYGRACKCEECGKTTGRIEWSNISHKYKRERHDWQQLCHICHFKYDYLTDWGVISRRFA